MKIRDLIETFFGLSIIGLSIYLYVNSPVKGLSPGLVILFLVGFLGACAPYIRSPQSEKLKLFFKSSGSFLHWLAGIALILGIVGTIISGSGLGLVFGIFAAALIYAIGSGLKSAK